MARPSLMKRIAKALQDIQPKTYARVSAQDPDEFMLHESAASYKVSKKSSRKKPRKKS